MGLFGFTVCFFYFFFNFFPLISNDLKTQIGGYLWIEEQPPSSYNCSLLASHVFFKYFYLF